MDVPAPVCRYIYFSRGHGGEKAGVTEKAK